MPEYRPIRPEIVDPKGVNPSVEPRPFPNTTDETRAATVTETGGEPLYDFDGTSNPYIDYQSIDLLLSLQNLRSEAYDEMCFYIMGQVKELLFKGIHFELVNARGQIVDDEIANALEILDRARAFAEYLTHSWDVLSTITAEGFNQFRNHLGQASGQLSFMYRHVEFILGNKSRVLASAHRNVAHVWPAIEEALTTPSLYDQVLRLLARSGADIEPSVLDRDWAEPYQHHPSVEQAWFEVYRRPAPDNLLYRLGEGLVTLDDQLSQYRWRHYVSVSRIIGAKPGTGGSSGVGWLRSATEHRYFPELWSVRASLPA